MDTKNKEALKQVGKMVGASTAAGAGVGVAGALINKKIKKKKESDSMNKEALNLVNETFNKLAGFGMEDLLPAETLKKMKTMADKGKDTVEGLKNNTGNGTNFKGKISNVKPNAPTLEQIKQMGGSSKGMSSKTKTAIGVGIAAASLLGGAVAHKKIKEKKQEKTAFDVVSETFEKIAK